MNYRTIKKTKRSGWSLVAVLSVLAVIVALGSNLMSGLVRQRQAMRRSVEERQARWLAASVAGMAPVESGDSWKPTLYRASREDRGGFVRQADHHRII
jgi:type II secretory pathway pseudopilin PulG